MIKTAVILAAGMGKRIREKSGDMPKGFLAFDEKPMVQYSIEKLLNAGVTKILIGTGYKSESYEELKKQYPQIECVYNEKYETTGSMYTLYLLKNYIHEDFLLLESDLLYEKSALNILLTHKMQDVILASQFTNNGDEVFVEVSSTNSLVNMTKNKEELENIAAELVGITKLTYSTFQQLCIKVKGMLQKQQLMDYEAALVEIARQKEIYVEICQDLVWCEVDDEQHLKWAVDVIYPMIKAREHVPRMIERTILLNPGPATTTDTVKYAQVVSDICPREEEFGQILDWISNELTKLVADPNYYTSVLFGGSGTAAVEAIISSIVGNEKIIIINNGAYGERMCKIANVYELDYIEYKSPAIDRINLINLEQLIRHSDQKIAHLAVVHCETTTGMLNPIKEIGGLCKKYEINMIVDAMSSFAAIPIDMKEMNIGYLAASSNKNLQGMAGVSFIIAECQRLHKCKKIKPRSLYLHLYDQFEYFQRTQQMRFTPPVQTIYALKQAIIETKYEGISRRYDRYSKSWETLINGIEKLGLTHLVHKDHHSKIITSIIEPNSPNYDFYQMHDYFASKGFTIYPGKLDKLGTFRIANIGNITYKDMEQFIDLLDLYIKGLQGGEEYFKS